MILGFSEIEGDRDRYTARDRERERVRERK
jgi:hypothetical protein